MQEKLFNRYFILIWFSMLCLMLIQNLMCSGIPLFFASRGFSTSFAGLLGLPFALFGILARTTGGYLMDRFGRRVIMILGPLLMGISSLLFLLLPFAPPDAPLPWTSWGGFFHWAGGFVHCHYRRNPSGEKQPGGRHLLGFYRSGDCCGRLAHRNFRQRRHL